MFEAINDRMLAVLEKREAAQSLGRRLATAERELRSQQERLAGLRVRVELEGADVKALEGLSLAALFHAVLGDKKERLKKEQQEFLAEKLKYDECEEGVRALEERVAGLREEREALGDPEGEYEVALAEKERAVATSGGAKAAALGSLTEQLVQNRSAIQELEEALSAGDCARRALKETAQSLSSARGWGTFDLLGGGLIATAVKHSHIDAAKRSAHRAQQELRRFQSELADVERVNGSGLQVEVGGFATFADYFFDGLIADWVVQSRVAKSAEQVERVLNSLRGTLTRLRTALATKERDAGRLDAERRRVIEAA